jgi:hypothetical protein
MGDVHWTTNLTTRELANQCIAMLVLHVDHDDGYDDAEILEAIEAFNDRLDDTTHANLIATLNVYAVSNWNHVAMSLTVPHLGLLLNAITEWVEIDDD